MKPLLVALTLALLLPLGGQAKRATLPVYDFSSEAWRDLVRTTVDEFNAVLPQSAPLLVYRSMKPGSCDNSWDRKPGIVVCSTDRADIVGTSWGMRSAGQIRLSDARIGGGYADNTVCHEFMHVLTGIDDNYDALPETSCVWGFILTAPGSFDVQALADTYSVNQQRAKQQHEKKRR